MGGEGVFATHEDDTEDTLHCRVPSAEELRGSALERKEEIAQPASHDVNLVLAADQVGEDVGALLGAAVEWGHRKRRRNCLWYPCARPWTRPSLPV